MNIVIAILIFGFLVFFHELGHFIVAKSCNVKVNEFMIGLGPRLIGFTKGETTFSIHLLPFGGACVMEGEDESSTDERAFTNRPLWQRFLIAFAGPFFNVLLAFILSMILLCNVGYTIPKIGDVIEGSAAEKGGLMAGDTLLSFNGYHLNFYSEVSVYNFFHNGEPLNVRYERDGETYTTLITPDYDEEQQRYIIGIYADGTVLKGNPLEIVKYSLAEVKYQIYITFESLRYLFTGKASLNDLSGPVGVVKVIGDTYEEASADGMFYAVMSMLSISIMLSANLGIMNLLPIPALDGGRIFIFLIEAIRRKKLDPDLEGKINLAGFALLMGLMVLIMFNDIYKLFA